MAWNYNKIRRPPWAAGRRVALLAIWVSTAAGQSTPADQLTRFKEKVQRDMTGIPNYTCLETIQRYRRLPHGHDFKPVDTVRLEVSTVAGKELFAWPGSHKFEDQDITALVPTGSIGTGMFSTFAQALFAAGNGAFQYHGEEVLAGHTDVRYDFQLSPEESGWEMRSNRAVATVAARGSFWFDPVSLDLVRLLANGDHMPYSLRLEEVNTQTDYARTQIGETVALLPKRSELISAKYSGDASRDVIEFSKCHEYRTQSTISFDPPPSAIAEVPKPAVRAVDLPAGLSVQIELETAIDSRTASVGDMLRARVEEEVREGADLVIPRGAKATGHLRKLDRGRGGFAIGIEFSEIEWEGAHARFFAELTDVDRKSAGAHRPLTYYDGRANRVLIEGGIRGAGIIYIDAASFHIPPGLRTKWRTLAASGRIEE